MLLNEIAPSKGLTKKAKRLGRGNGSGKGNYSARGLKGQGSRSGGGMPAWFEGGQTPLHMRLPKLKGFKRNPKLVKEYQIVNLGSIEKDPRLEKGMIVDKKVLKELNYIKKEDALVKILGNGDFSKSLTFKGLDVFSASAKQKIQDAKGIIE